MTCDAFRDRIARRAGCGLAGEEALDLDRHLDDCDECRTFARRTATLVWLLEAIPETAYVPAAGRPRRRSFLSAVAAAAAMAAALAGGPWLGPRPVLEGEFEALRVGVYRARDGRSSLFVAGHRLRCREGTEVRLVGRTAVAVEAGKVDVRGTGGGLVIHTPLGRVETVGTEFVVEVARVKKSDVALAGGAVWVGVMVSSGIVLYAEGGHRLRLEPGESVIAESGKTPRRVSARGAEERERSLRERERELETKLAALERELGVLRTEWARRGVAPPAPLSPADRQAKLRRLGRSLARTWNVLLRDEALSECAPAPESVPGEGELRVEKTIVLENERSKELAKELRESFTLGLELGINLFDRDSIFRERELLKEYLAELAGGDAIGPQERGVLEASVDRHFGAAAGPWDFRCEERLANARALLAVTADLQGRLKEEQLQQLYKANMSWSTLGWRPSSEALLGEVASTLGLDEAQKSTARPIVQEWISRVPPLDLSMFEDGQRLFEHGVRSLERHVELVRRLEAAFPDKKEQLNRLGGM
jgi:hypothetical protein